MMTRIVRVLTGIFVALLLVFLVATNLGKPRILVLHSYSTAFSWVVDIDKGLNRVLDSKAYSIRWHYMDTKRHPSEVFKKKAGETARKMIDSWNPDVIIAVDDNAQKYAAAYYNNHPTINIVFTGVNATPESYKYDKAANATGVLERIPFNEFREVFSQILPSDKMRIVHISDASTTSKLIHDELETVEWAPLKLVRSIQCETFDEWKSAINKSHEIGDIVLVTHYHTIKDKNGNMIAPKKIIEWTEPRLKIPDIGCWGFFVEDGGMMAVAVSPYEQGEEAAKMAVDIIDNNTTPASIKVKTNNQYVVYVRGRSVRERKLKLPKILEAFAKATNNYYE